MGIGISGILSTLADGITVVTVVWTYVIHRRVKDLKSELFRLRFFRRYLKEASQQRDQAYSLEEAGDFGLNMRRTLGEIEAILGKIVDRMPREDVTRAKEARHLLVKILKEPGWLTKGGREFGNSDDLRRFQECLLNVDLAISDLKRTQKERQEIPR